MIQGVTLLGADEARTFKAAVRLRLPGDAPGAGGPAVLLAADETREFEAPVSVRMPGEDEPREFTALFLEQPGDALLRLTARRGDLTRKAMGSILRGWHGVEDAKGTALPYTPEALDLAYQRPYFRNAVIAAYLGEIRGERDAGREFSVTFSEQPTEVLRELAGVRDDLPRKVLANIIIQWDSVEDTDGAALHYSQATLGWVLQRPYFRNAIVNTYLRQISGDRDLGNSVIAPGIGGAARP